MPPPNVAGSTASKASATAAATAAAPATAAVAATEAAREASDDSRNGGASPMNGTTSSTKARLQRTSIVTSTTKTTPKHQRSSLVSPTSVAVKQRPLDLQRQRSQVSTPLSSGSHTKNGDQQQPLTTTTTGSTRQRIGKAPRSGANIDRDSEQVGPSAHLLEECRSTRPQKDSRAPAPAPAKVNDHQQQQQQQPQQQPSLSPSLSPSPSPTDESEQERQQQEQRALSMQLQSMYNGLDVVASFDDSFDESINNDGGLAGVASLLETPHRRSSFVRNVAGVLRCSVCVCARVCALSFVIVSHLWFGPCCND